MDEWLDDKQIKEISHKNPEQIYRSDDGRVAFAGMIFKNQEQLDSFIDMMKKPPRLLMAIVKVYKFFVRKKK